jgi:hypothetical protein
MGGTVTGAVVEVVDEEDVEELEVEELEVVEVSIVLPLSWATTKDRFGRNHTSAMAVAAVTSARRLRSFTRLLPVIPRTASLGQSPYLTPP